MLDAVGRTPAGPACAASAAIGLEVFAKIEWYGPTGSVKDRIYHEMLERAEERGALRRGMTVIECSTGNAGYRVLGRRGDQGVSVRRS